MTQEEKPGKQPKIPHYGVVGAEPLSETLIPKIKEATPQECIDDLRELAIANPERVITRNYYRINGKYAESCWNSVFGTWAEFKRQAGVTLTRQQHGLERAIAKHASVDHYRQVGEQREGYAAKYLRERPGRFKTIVVASDLHDTEVDPFFLRTFVDTIRRVQPDIVCFGGDVFDLPEFGRYGVDPREWDVVGRMRFAHEQIFAPVRKAAPNAQLDFVEGNHENRLLRHMADATPALRAVLADLHGFTIAKLFGLDRFEINYIAKADLASFTQRDHQRELQNNYKIYWDAFLVHHFPHARRMGLPGVNGHHHQHVVWSEFNPVYGAYEWHQLGAGHRRKASYCEGERWHNGFAIINVDTHTRAVNIDYVPVTSFAVAGGQFYYRQDEETVGDTRVLLSAVK